MPVFNALFKIEGTITELGQYRITPNEVHYQWVEISDQTGQRTHVKEVSIRNEAASLFAIGNTGEFFFEKVDLGLKRLFGIRLQDGNVAFVARNVRWAIGVVRLVPSFFLFYLYSIGMTWAPFWWIAFALLVWGAAYILTPNGDTRSKMVFGTGEAADQKRQQLPVQI